MNESTFIQKNKHQLIVEVALLLSKHPELDKNYILNQINGLQKSKLKLPSFYANPNIVYPVGLSMEQCSSEQTALFKSQLVKGKTIVDLTGGFGVDAYFFSKHFESVTYVEQNEELFEIATQNFNHLKATINCNNTTCEDFLAKNNTKFDIAYIDPSRRYEKKRVFKLDECTPNIIKLLPQLLNTANQILIKTSPLLDIKQSIKDLGLVSKVWVASLNNDCKEVLYLIDGEITEPLINAINITKNNTEIFEFTYADETTCFVEFSEPLTYLYEPNASVLKAGAFKSIAEKFNVKKISSNSHLYTSINLISNFPGRIFVINNTIDYNEKSVKQLGIKKANISTRNFPNSVSEIKKKLKLTDGGDVYLFATRDLNEKPVLIICSKI